MYSMNDTRADTRSRCFQAVLGSRAGAGTDLAEAASRRTGSDGEGGGYGASRVDLDR